MKTRKPLSILLTLCLIVGLLPWSVLPARADGDIAQVGTTGYATLADAVAAWTNGTTLTLLHGVTIYSALAVPAFGVTLDLNGYGINAGSGNQRVITVGSDSIIKENPK